MKKRIALLVLVAAAAFVVMATAPWQTTAADKVLVCHQPGHYPSVAEPVTIEVSLSAAEAHANHGDGIGAPCP